MILEQQGYQSAHIHPTGWLSGVIYLKNVPTMGKQEESNSVWIASSIRIIVHLEKLMNQK